MLRHLLLPHADPDIPFERWAPFTDAALLQTCALIGVFAALIALCYALHARRLKIRRPQDVFRPFAPLRWLLLSLAPGALAAGSFYRQFTWQFPSSPASPLPTSLRLFVFAAGLSLLLGYALLCLPGITPAKFRYRPILWFVRGARPGGGA